MKNLIILLFFISIIFTGKSQNTTTIYLVRHAEKVTIDPANKNPLLTEQGQKRAKDLAKKLKKQKILAIYSTDFQRTKLTAQPLADKKQLMVKIYDPKQLKSFATMILQEHKGGKVLIVGHSNTVLETIEAFGVERPIKEILDNEYDYLFTVEVAENGVATVKAEHYGAKNLITNDVQMMKNN